MGKLYKRGGIYHADYTDRAGQRIRCSTRTSDPQVAKQRLRDLELATTDRAPHSTETLAHALSYFIDVACAAKPTPTIESYQQKARHLARLIGTTLLDLVDRETIERYIAARLSEKAARHSVHKELVVLRGALESAHERKRTVTTGAVVPKFRAAYVPRTTYLTPDQFVALVDHLVPAAPARAKERTLREREQRRNRRALYCLLIALASPRSGEVEAMEWRHVDLGRGILRVPKGKTISRVVAIHPVLRPWLEAMAEDSGPIVEPWTNVRRDLPRACERAGVPRCTPNDLRRTFASWLVQAGTSLLVVSRLLGHSSTRMVDMVYGQLDEATLAAAIQRLPGGCDAGVTYDLTHKAHGGTPGHGALSPSITNSVENPRSSSVDAVPGDGVEPPTRGFSGLASLAPKPAHGRVKLRLVG